MSDAPARHPCPELLAKFRSHFGVEIHPAEAGMVFTCGEMVDLLRVKIDAAGLGKRWPQTQIWRELQTLLADHYGDWPEDIQQHHPLRRDEHRGVL